MKATSEIDSKFRFVIIAAKRAKQLLAGSKPRVKSKSKNLIRVAQEEVEQGLVSYELIQVPLEEQSKGEEEIFIGEELGSVEDVPEVKQKAKTEEKPKEEAKKKTKKKKKT